MEKDNDDVWLSVAAWEKRSCVNGPGERFVIWVQGCPFRCPGCFNSDYLQFEGGAEYSVEDLARVIQGVSGIEGVTFSGGEPMAHAKGLYYLSQRLKTIGMTIFCYTGYTLEELQQKHDPWIDHLLSCLDILIDGRYDKTQQVDLHWRGSANQRVHFLSSAYKDLAEEVNHKQRETELIIKENGFISTGILDVKFLNRLEEILVESITRESPERMLKGYAHTQRSLLE
jgi:anaerobic ribonucleoside-triphosphate reductase activating protein